MNRHFTNYELCDGGCCEQRESCARYMGNVKLQRGVNPYVVFNQKPWPGKCPYFLRPPHPRYPQNDETED